MDIIVSTGNTHKLEEIKGLFSDLQVNVMSLYDRFDSVPEIIEDGRTFEENAFKKIDWIKPEVNKVFIADDSGLVVPALDGAPGIYSARYAGDGATDLENCQKLLNEMTKVDKRDAYFYCVIAVLYPNGEKASYSGRVEGVITHEMAGKNGFGYDPLFIPNEYSDTFANLPSEIKNACSHRFRALEAFKHNFKLPHGSSGRNVIAK